MNSSSRNGAKVIWLGVHTTEGFMRVRDLRDWKEWPGSSHAASDETGALWGPAEGFVPYDRMAWTLRNGNPLSENIEQCGWARWTRAEWLARPLLLDATARWLAERAAARGIPLRRLTHAEIRARVPGVLGHGDYSVATGDGTHTDPGPNYPWDVVLAKANAYRDGTEGSSIVLDDATQLQISKIVVNALTTPLIQWDAKSGNAPTSLLQQVQLNAQGLSLIYGELQATREVIAQLSTGGGTSAAIDLKAIEEAGRRGAQSALDELTVTVSTSDDTDPA